MCVPPPPVAQKTWVPSLATPHGPFSTPVTRVWVGLVPSRLARPIECELELVQNRWVPSEATPQGALAPVMKLGLMPPPSVSERPIVVPSVFAQYRDAAWTAAPPA